VLWLASTVTVVVLLFGYHTSTNRAADAGATSSASSPAGSSSAPTGGSSPSSPSPSGTKSSASTTTTKTKTYTGSVAQTRWGPVQVAITVRGDKITKVDVLQQPNGNQRDAEINGQALPILINETMDAQSAQIDMVSGATVTSNGYLKSLQSALDQAGR
jgi:uncharacterized protein with FMN-binding domain